MEVFVMFAHITANEAPDLFLYLVTGIGIGTGFGMVFLMSGLTGSSSKMEDDSDNE